MSRRITVDSDVPPLLDELTRAYREAYPEDGWTRSGVLRLYLRYGLDEIAEHMDDEARFAADELSRAQ
jgi:hypothetical protein